MSDMSAVLKEPWFDRGAYGFEPRTLNIAGHQMRVVVEGKGPDVVLVHGTPSWSFEWRHAIRDLSADHRVIAPDHLGFGLSDRPVSADYTLGAHRARLLAVLDALGCTSFGLVVHDFAGPIALPILVSAPQRVRSVTALQSWCWGMELDPGFRSQKWLVGSALMRWAYLQHNMSPRFMVPQSWGRRNKLTPAMQRHFTQMFPTPQTRHGAYGFVRALLDEGASLDALWPQVRAQLTQRKVAVGWGAADGIVKPLHLERWKAEVPGAAFTVWDDVGHFPQEEAPAEVAALIRANLQ